MKQFFTAMFLLALISCGGETTTPTPTPTAPLEVVKTTVGTLIGTPVTQAIGSNGGSATVVSAGAKIIVPAGALPDGSSLTVQAIANTLDGVGEGIQISGDAWTKPVTMQFSYPAGETDANHYRIAIQQNDGSWITSKNAKVDTANRTVSVRLGPDSSATASAALGAKANLKPTAKLDRRRIVMTKSLYLKPGSATVKLGGSASFTAYAKLAVTQAVPAMDDDELVPLLQPAISSQTPIDDDEIAPLARLRVVVREYPFTNNKAGFTRLWSVEGPGKIEASGATSGVYTAPSASSARGKTAKVYFTSFDAKGAVVISGNVKIEGVQAYRVSGSDGGGTISGTVCDPSKPFDLNFVYGGGATTLNFVPTAGSSTNGSWSGSGPVETESTVDFTGSYEGFGETSNGAASTLRMTGSALVTTPNGSRNLPVDSTWTATPIDPCQ